MYTQEKGKGVANVSRQTWDKDYYEKKAQMRASGQLEENEVRPSCGGFTPSSAVVMLTLCFWLLLPLCRPPRR